MFYIYFSNFAIKVRCDDKGIESYVDSQVEEFYEGWQKKKFEPPKRVVSWHFGKLWFDISSWRYCYPLMRSVFGLSYLDFLKWKKRSDGSNGLYLWVLSRLLAQNIKVSTEQPICDCLRNVDFVPCVQLSNSVGSFRKS